MLHSNASSAGSLAVAASPTLAVLAVTARELLHEIEAAATDSPRSVAHSSKSSKRRSHKSKSKSKQRHRQLEDEHELHQVLLEQHAAQFLQPFGTAHEHAIHEQQQYLQHPCTGVQQLQQQEFNQSPYQPQVQHMQGLLEDLQEQLQQQQTSTLQQQQTLQEAAGLHPQPADASLQQHSSQDDPVTSTTDSVGWSAILQKYELHKMRVAQLVGELDEQQLQRQHHAEQQQQEQLLGDHEQQQGRDLTAAAVSREARQAIAVCSRQQQAEGLGTGLHGGVMEPHSAAQVDLRLRMQQLQSSGSEACHSTGRCPRGRAGSPRPPAAAAAAAAAGYAAQFGMAGPAPGVALGSQADLEFLLAERHTVAALLKQLAAAVAADAATSAHGYGLSMPGKHRHERTTANQLQTSTTTKAYR
jgi:hypothetical protein